MKCPSCKCEEVNLIRTPKLLHYGKEECAKCGRFIKWVKTPKDHHKEEVSMKIREDFEKVLDDCEARYAVNSPLAGEWPPYNDWRDLTVDDAYFKLGKTTSSLLGAKTPAERYAAAMDYILLLLMLASKLREDASWESRLGIEVIQGPVEPPEVTTKECEGKP